MMILFTFVLFFSTKWGCPNPKKSQKAEPQLVPTRKEGFPFLGHQKLCTNFHKRFGGHPHLVEKHNKDK